MKKEKHAQFRNVEVVENNERAASDRENAKDQFGGRAVYCGKSPQDMFDGGIDAVALLSDDTHAKQLDALSEEGVELIEGCLRNANVPHFRDGATPRFDSTWSVSVRASSREYERPALK